MYVVVPPSGVGEGVFFSFLCVVVMGGGLRLLRMRSCVILLGLVLIVEPVWGFNVAFEIAQCDA